jgi:DNA polymerase III subunit alpha
MKIISKEYLGEQEVYDIGVASINGAHNFVLNNGLVASNCFNKAHSVSYSMLTYITAYLKAHYPAEFFTALMSTRSKTLQPKSWAVKAPEYISEAKRFGVEVLPPSVNKSGFEFTIHGSEVYFGLNAIRDVGKTAAKAIIKARGNTPFKDIKDFLNRINLQKVNTKVFEALVHAGAFDKMGYSRNSLIDFTSNLYKYIKDLEDYKQREIDYIEREAHNERVSPLIERRNFLRNEIKKISNRINKGKEKENDVESLHLYEEELQPLEDQNLKRLPPLAKKDLPEFPEIARTKFVPLTLKQIMDQANYIGCYIGGHPLDLIQVSKKDLDTLIPGVDAKIAGVVLSIKQIKTRAGKEMAFIEIDDSTRNAEIVLFPTIWEKVKEQGIQEADIIKAKVKVEATDPDIKLILKYIERIEIKDEMDT